MDAFLCRWWREVARATGSGAAMASGVAAAAEQLVFCTQAWLQRKTAVLIELIQPVDTITR